MEQSHSITRLLNEWTNGKPEVLDDLMPLVYEELRRQANAYLRNENPNHTLQATALIHETYLKLINQREAHFNSRSHFFAIAANLMRRILVDHARAKHRDKRGGNAETLPLDEAINISQKEQNVDLVALDEALNRLEEMDERQARVVELRYFSGLSLEETAEVLKISRTTVAQDWALAKAWLYRELS
ncbi:MAG: sigma-70 family RNA polymerase sigma factor [Pyrinomonadaceae bacterium]|nr:sigma-70 family RNA polymerase sigma factor [Pyrinomonadaceae bacterium]